MSLHIGICTLNAMRTLPVVMDAIAQAKLHDKLWVVDSGSTDGTVEFAKNMGAHVIHRTWDGFVGQHRFLLDHCRSQGGDWALMLDADEWPDPSLWKAIETFLADAPPAVSGAMLNRQLILHGKPLRYVCQPERRLRLVRPERSTVVGSFREQAEGVHERIQTEVKPFGCPECSCMIPFSILKTHCPKILATPASRPIPIQRTAVWDGCWSRRWRPFVSNGS